MMTINPEETNENNVVLAMNKLIIAKKATDIREKKQQTGAIAISINTEILIGSYTCGNGVEYRLSIKEGIHKIQIINKQTLTTPLMNKNNLLLSIALILKGIAIKSSLFTPIE